MIKNRFKKALSMVLAVALVFSATGSVVGIAQGADNTSVSTQAAVANKESRVQTVSTYEEAFEFLEEETLPKAGEAQSTNGGYYPSVVIPGVFQSRTLVYDENWDVVLDENGKEVESFLSNIDVNGIVAKLALPLARTLITQKDKGFTDKAVEVIEDVFGVNEIGLDGKVIHNVAAEKYNHSVARCTQRQKDFIYANVPIDDYSEIVGEENLYYLSYNSFGNNLEIAQELYELIMQAVEETGCDKVNILPISLGGTIANSLLEFYPEVYQHINKIVYIVPALDGTRIIGDIYAGEMSTADEEMLYSKLFPSLVDGYQGYLINVAIRLFPKQVIHDLIDKAVAKLQDLILINCTCMWSLVPSSYYEDLADELLADDAHSEIRRQTDLYYQAQVNSKQNIQAVIDSGAEVFNMVDYNCYLYALTPSWDQCNADGILNLESTSMGAYSLGVDIPLPEGYVQQNTHCNDPSHNHISPDGVLDASTGLLPDHTFYFYNQHHEGTGRNDVIMSLAIELLVDDNFKDVYSYPDRYPQFNVGRETKGFVRGSIPQAKKVDLSTLSDEDALELQEAIAQAEAMIDNTVVVYEDYEQAVQRLENILVKIGEKESKEKTPFEKFAEVACKVISDALFKIMGGKGFSD